LSDRLLAAARKAGRQPTAADVVAIHANAFRACRAALAAVRSQGRSTSVLLHGQPVRGAN
jgi:hypothetical protein